MSILGTIYNTYAGVHRHMYNTHRSPVCHLYVYRLLGVAQWLCVSALDQYARARVLDQFAASVGPAGRATYRNFPPRVHAAICVSRYTISTTTTAHTRRKDVWDVIEASLLPLGRRAQNRNDESVDAATKGRIPEGGQGGRSTRCTIA